MSTPHPTIAQILMSALRQEEFVLYGQDIRPTRPQPGERPLVEILVRFKQEEERLLPPGTFFPILEENDLMPMLDRWVFTKLGKSINAALAIKPDWLVPCHSLNLSAPTLDDKGFGAFVKKHLQVASIPGEAVAFEIAWPTVPKQGAEVHAFMKNVRKAGCRIVIAGFDGEKESMAVIRYLKPDFIKVSTRLLRKLRPGTAEAEALGLLNSTCQALGIRTIAEQIESDEAIAAVTEIGIDYVQGFGVSRPRPVY